MGPTLELGPDSSHVHGVHNSFIVREDAMHGDAPLIPILRTNFRVDVAVERLSYPINAISTVRPHLPPVHLHSYDPSRDLNDSRNLPSCLNIKRHKNRQLIVEYMMGNGSTFGDIIPPTNLPNISSMFVCLPTPLFHLHSNCFIGQIDTLVTNILLELIPKRVVGSVLNTIRIERIN